MEELLPLVLVIRQPGEPADRGIAGGVVDEAERIDGVLERPHRPCRPFVIGGVEEPDAGHEAVVERALVEVLGIGPFHEVEPATARQVLEAEGILLVAATDDADAGDLADLDPVFGDRGVVAQRRLRGKGRGVGVQLVREVVFTDKVVELVHPAVDAETGATEVDRVSEQRCQTALILGLGWAGALRERHLVHLDPAAHVDAEVLVRALRLESVIPLRRHPQVTADLVGLLRLFFILLGVFLGILGAGVHARRLRVGSGNRFDALCRLLFEFGQPLFEGRHLLPVVLEGLADVIEGIEASGDTRQHEGRGVVGFGDHQIGLGSRRRGVPLGGQAQEGSGPPGQPRPPCTPRGGVLVGGDAHAGRLRVALSA